tara:strand:- start:3459 stop:3560 length:102 start_codon:yes stop_codon:yes gene_type:complete
MQQLRQQTGKMRTAHFTGFPGVNNQTPRLLDKD